MAVIGSFSDNMNELLLNPSQAKEGKRLYAWAEGNVFEIESCPHDWLFPQCAAVVNHGGAGTLAAGIRAGRPTIVCATQGDQPFHGSLARASSWCWQVPGDDRFFEGDIRAPGREHRGSDNRRINHRCRTSNKHASPIGRRNVECDQLHRQNGDVILISMVDQK